MACKSRKAENHCLLDAEIGIHFPGRNGPKKRLVMVFPQVVICLDCGVAEFVMPETELRVLSEGTEQSSPA